MPQFIEKQFPIARLSAESYKERKANNGQTLTRLGKWWGRKPLILVRASIIGLLMPASSDPHKDREIFLKILTMDDDGTWSRCKGNIPVADWRNAAPPEILKESFTARGFKQGLSDEEKQEICERIWDSLTPAARHQLDAKRRRPVADRKAFDALPYAERITHCERPENVDGPSPDAWAEINAHLGTHAGNLAELVDQLGQRLFGHTPRVGDAFCGGGSIPFEAARIGCEAFGSDLNPVAGLLTWASLNLLGGGQAVQEEVIRVQTEVLEAADKQITDWGIEHNERGERADAYLYCVEVKPEGCDYYIPLAPGWLVGEKSKVVCTWHRTNSDRLEPKIKTVEESEIAEWKGDSKRKITPKNATVVDSRVIDPFDPGRSWSVEALRGPEGLRRWSNDDVVPRPGDVFQERLYCIRWINANGERRYAAPTADDLARETRVLELLRERFDDWQSQGFIPSKAIPENGDETARLYRERGWTHWHHLFTPRQILTHSLLAKLARLSKKHFTDIACLLGIGRTSNWNSRLSQWLSDSDHECGNHVFYSQALNSFYNYSNRPLNKFDTSWFIFTKTNNIKIEGNSFVMLSDARDINENCDFWITDPPCADAVNYHELGDFFLAWYDKQLAKAFPEWTPDARAELAVRGDGEDFRRSMVDIYRNLAQHMPENGMQLVMFTHKNPAVWADLGMILWAAGLKATAAWTISTETDAVGIKKGDYVQGTVCLVLRKRGGSEAGFMDEIYPLVEDEVKRQIASMQVLDEGGEPNFNDADYQLAAYAAALKVLTGYATLDGRDVEHEVFAVRQANQQSYFQVVIERAIGIACEILVPRGLEQVWRSLSLPERFYLRALEIESRGERRKGMYEELARGFGVTEIGPMLHSTKANGSRMMTASNFGRALLASAGQGESADPFVLGQPSRRGRGSAAGGGHPFASSILRHLLFAIRETTTNENSPTVARQYLRDTFGSRYWELRERLVLLLDWLTQIGNAAGMEEWQPDSEAARILSGRLRNDEA